MGLTGRATTAGVLDDVKKRWTTHRYLEPGTCARIPGLSDVTFHVLGPPRDRKKLWKDNPSKSHSEVYLTDRVAKQNKSEVDRYDGASAAFFGDEVTYAAAFAVNRELLGGFPLGIGVAFRQLAGTNMTTLTLGYMTAAIVE